MTHASSSWPASLRIDPVILRSANVQEFEEIEIVNLATGRRWTTFAQAAGEQSGEVHVQAGSDQHVRAGDVVSLVSWGLLHDGQTLAHRAKVLTLDGSNRVVALTEE